VLALRVGEVLEGVSEGGQVPAGRGRGRAGGRWWPGPGPSGRRVVHLL